MRRKLHIFRQRAASKVNKEGKGRYNEAIRTSRRTTNQIRWFKISVSRTARGHDTKCLKRFSHFFNSNYITADLKQLFPMIRRHHLNLLSRCWGRTIYGLLYAFPPSRQHMKQSVLQQRTAKFIFLATMKAKQTRTECNNESKHSRPKLCAPFR